MLVDTTFGDPLNVEADAIVIGVRSQSDHPKATQIVDQHLDGLITRLIENDEIGTTPNSIQLLFPGW